ncbi:MAG: PilZ domain-containing protein [Acidobacteriota bacterium]|nr:PilZ domain-containing protein [Acidobacteriota bacterium]
MNEQRRVHRSANCWCGHGGVSHFSGRVEIACGECDRASIDLPETLLVEERRRYDRYPLPQPVRTTVGASPAYVVDASITGLGVLQHSSIAPSVGESCKLMFHSDFGPITLECEIARASSDGNEGTFQTGLRIVAADAASESRLRMLVMALAVPVSKASGH